MCINDPSSKTFTDMYELWENQDELWELPSTEVSVLKTGQSSLSSMLSPPKQRPNFSSFLCKYIVHVDDDDDDLRVRP